MSTKPTVDQKPSMMAEIGTDYAIVRSGMAEIHKLEVLLAARVKPIFDTFGAGPHKMPMPVEVPDPEQPGKSKTVIKIFFVSFRKSGDTYAFSAVDQDSVT